MLSTTSSISPRVFIRMPRLAAPRQSMPVSRAAAHVPVVATRCNRMTGCRLR